MQIRAVDLDSVSQVSRWRYQGELAIYSQEEIPDNSEEYFFVYENDTLIGFGVVGVEAMVKGQSLSEELLDVGLGMNPDLIRKGNGNNFTRLVGENAEKIAKDRGYLGLRCAILDWNVVSQKMALKYGFTHSGAVTNARGTFMEFELRF